MVNSLDIMNNIYSNYYCGQEVMAQKWRTNNQSNLSYCPAFIQGILSNSNYSIEFKDGTRQILKNDFFYAKNLTNQLELNNYISIQKEQYKIGTKVIINKNLDIDNKEEEFVDGVIIEENYDDDIYKINLIISNTNLETSRKNIYTICDNKSKSIIKTTTNDIIDENITIPSVSKNVINKICKEKDKFSPYSFFLKNKKNLGIILVCLSCLTILIIIYKIFSDVDKLKTIMYELKPLIYASNFIIALFTLFFFYYLIEKKYMVFIIIFLFLDFYLKDSKQSYLYQSFINKNMEYFDISLKIGWIFLFSFSFGPIFLIIHFLLFIPSKINIFKKYIPNFLEYFYGLVPYILKNNMTLYILILFFFMFIYILFITYAFNGNIEISKENKTANIMRKIK